MSGTDRRSDNGLPWINPVGGIGDMLMVGGVLKQVVERDPSRRFNLVQRTRYRPLFDRHPAIAHIGFPRPGDPILRVDYWGMEEPGEGEHRPYQILARAFGLPAPAEERLFLAGVPEKDPPVLELIPWGKLNVAIGPASDSPRKMVRFESWHRLTELLHADGAFVLQPGLLREVRVRNAYSARGMTTPQETVALLRRCDLVITLDNFLAHAARLAGVPAVVLWGPTSHLMYGYPGNAHLQAAPACGLPDGRGCIHHREEGVDGGRKYGTPCPRGAGHCLDSIPAETVLEAARALLRERGVWP